MESSEKLPPARNAKEANGEAGERVPVQSSPLLVRFVALMRAGADADTGADAQFEFESEPEHERRYKPAARLSEALLASCKRLEIRQTYVRVVDQEATDPEKQHMTLRFRETVDEAGKTLQRIAYKMHIEADKRGRNEAQLRFSKGSADSKEFERLQDMSYKEYAPIQKTRYYIPHTIELSDGTALPCEIHYDVHHGPLEGLIRIEIEFKGADPAEAERRFLGAGGSARVPAWIGEDITERKEFNGQAMSRGVHKALVGDTMAPELMPLTYAIDQQAAIPERAAW